jgi:membrane-bound lytic murein transglycosylase MltF
MTFHHESLSLPLEFARNTGDLDEMLKQRRIRALITINPIAFFYVQGNPAGYTFEALQALERFINEKYKTGALKVEVTFIPMRPDQLEAALTEGIGDVIAQGVMITPAREDRVAFTIPIQPAVTQIIVTGKDVPLGTTFDDLAGKPIYARLPATTPVRIVSRDCARRQRSWARSEQVVRQCGT